MALWCWPSNVPQYLWGGGSILEPPADTEDAHIASRGSSEPLRGSKLLPKEFWPKESLLGFLFHKTRSDVFMPLKGIGGQGNPLGLLPLPCHSHWKSYLPTFVINGSCFYSAIHNVPEVEVPFKVFSQSEEQSYMNYLFFLIVRFNSPLWFCLFFNPCPMLDLVGRMCCLQQWESRLALASYRSFQQAGRCFPSSFSSLEWGRSLIT